METSMIEKLDKERYNLLKWSTIGWAIWFGAFIFPKEFTDNSQIIAIAVLIGLPAWVIWTVNLLRILKLTRELRLDRKLNEALNDELHQLNMHKSFQIGYWVVIITAAVFICIAEFVEIKALLVTQVIVYLGALSVMISGLIYNRS
jgi:hypothetical protein